MVKEKLISLLKHPRSIPIAVSVAAFGAGIGIGYLIGKRSGYSLVQLTDNLDIDPDDEIIAIKQNIVRPPPVVISEENHPVFTKPNKEQQPPMSVIHNSGDPKNTSYDQITKKDPKVTTAIPEKSNPIDEPVDEEVQEVVEENRRVLFAENNEEWNYDTEVKLRNPSSPYVIHKDEFFEDSMKYAQVTLTYYSGDDILVDEDDSPIYNHAMIVGELKFGHGSNDPNVVYVRNDKRKAEYEILFDPGMYSTEVLGLEIEPNERAKNLNHSKTRKFRPE